MTRFYLPQGSIREQRGHIVGQELEHLRRVLRLRAGDAITVFDDAGWEHAAVIRHLSAEKAEIEILKSYRTETESSLNLTLAVAVTKGEKMDLVVEKATELGVQSIVPFFSAYTVPRLDDKKFFKRSERWKKIALAAAKQSGRNATPEIMALCDFDELINLAWSDALKLLFWENEPEQTLERVHAGARDVRALLLVVGPEGGFSAAEAERAQKQGFQTVRLGRRILRAETAAVVATSLVQFLWGDLR